MRADVYWIDGPWPGRLAIVARPRGGDWLKDEIEAWRETGINVVVSLLSRDEESELGIEEEARQAQESDLTFVRFTIDDYGVPLINGCFAPTGQAT